MTSYRLPKLLIIDARDHIMGRLAATIAKHLLMGTKIVVLRAERIVMSGHLIRNKLKMLSFRGHKMNTNPRRGPFQYVQPSRMFYRVIRGMLPHKRPRGKRALRLLHVYDGIPPRFTHVKKVKLVTAFRAIRLDPNKPFTSLGRLMTCFGWPHGKLMVKLEHKRRLKLAQTFKIQREIQKLKVQAIQNVAKRYLGNDDTKKDYEWLTQYEWDLPLPKDVENPPPPKPEWKLRGMDLKPYNPNLPSQTQFLPREKLE